MALFSLASRCLVSLRRHPSAVLLVVQLTALVGYPFIENTTVGHAGLGVLGTAVLVVTTAMVRRTPWTTVVSVALAVPAVSMLALQAVRPMPHLLPWSAGLEALFYFYAAGSLIAYMLADRQATTDELFAAGATFTLLAWGFAYLFLALQAVLPPGSFTASVNPEQARTWTELMFLSFALLSSTGIGDVVPINPVARAVCSVEMFVGVIYLAAVVSRLIGLTLQSHPTAHGPD